MKIIGIIGGVGAGKSYFANFFNKSKIKIIELDEIGHDILKTTGVKKKLTVCFGSSILSGRKTTNIDRNKLGSIVFKNKKNLLKLNSIVHPAMRKNIIKAVSAAQHAGYEIALLVGAILVRDKLYDKTDFVINIFLDAQIRKDRIFQNKHIEKSKISAIMSLQEPDINNILNADISIRGDLCEKNHKKIADKISRFTKLEKNILTKYNP